MQGDGMTHVTSVPHRQGAPPPLMFPLPGFPILQLYCLPASLTMILPAAMTPPTMPESAGAGPCSVLKSGGGGVTSA